MEWSQILEWQKYLFFAHKTVNSIIWSGVLDWRIGVEWSQILEWQKNLLFAHKLVYSMEFCLFCCFTSQVNSYGHCGLVSSPNHTFSWAGLNKRLTSNSCTYFLL